MTALERIAGYEAQKEELQKLIEIFNNRKEYLKKGASLPKGIVFYGLAGTGKTLFADVLAESCALNKIKITMDGDPSGRSLCRQIRSAFKRGARSGVPTMIFFDELDKVLPNAGERYFSDRSKTILAQLLTLIDGMDSSDNIVFVATCNNYYDLPESITRPGRLDKKIWFGLPDYQSRAEILKLYMEATLVTYELTPESIAKLTEEFSCAALKTLVNECVLHSGEEGFAGKELIQSKIAEISEENIQEEVPDELYMLDAIRNAGSCIVANAFEGGDYVLTLADGVVCNNRLDAIVRGSRDFYPDDDDYDDDEESGDEDEPGWNMVDYSYQDYMVAMTALVAGFSAEVILTGNPHDNLHRNMRLAHNLFTRMCYNGMFGVDMVFYSINMENNDCSNELKKKMEELYTDILETCISKAEEIIEKNQAIILALAKLLCARKSLEKRECEVVIEELGGIIIE